MQAVHFGAGNIGRGFIGNLLFQSGFEMCFVDVNNELVNLLNEKKQYRVQLANEAHESLIVKNVRAVNSILNPQSVIAEIVRTDLVTAAVGPTVLPLIAGLLAEGLKERLVQTQTPLTIIACENMIGGSDFLKDKIYEKLTADEQSQFDELFSFPNAAVDRIVPNQSLEEKTDVLVEPFYEWVVEASQNNGNNPPVQGITYVDDLKPYIERKLFTVNTGHCTVAYFGYQAGIDNIHEALQNNDIKQITKCVLRETGDLLIEKYKFNEQEHNDYICKIMERFKNPYISDHVTRVARSPKRKLSYTDRFVGPATQYVELFGKNPTQLVKVIASALHYDFAGDPEAEEIQQKIQKEGIGSAIKTYTGLKPGTSLFQEIEEHYCTENLIINNC